MCHPSGVGIFNVSVNEREIDTVVNAVVFGNPDAPRKIAVLPDIFGVNTFYRGFCAYLANKGAEVFLVNPFSKLGELAEATFEAARERRQKLRDNSVCDSIEALLKDEDIDAVTGFCLGGTYVFEMAHRGFSGICHAIYPFPQGSPNADALTPAFEYLSDQKKPISIVLGTADTSVGEQNIQRLQKVAEENPAIDLYLYPGSAHGFMKDLEGTDETLIKNASDALAVTEKILLA